MKCFISWCSEQRSPAIGIANLRGTNQYTAGTDGQYPLCSWHYKELLEGRWTSVELLGWEDLPLTEDPKPASPSVVELSEACWRQGGPYQFPADREHSGCSGCHCLCHKRSHADIHHSLDSRKLGRAL